MQIHLSWQAICDTAPRVYEEVTVFRFAKDCSNRREVDIVWALGSLVSLLADRVNLVRHLKGLQEIFSISVLRRCPKRQWNWLARLEISQEG